MNGACAGCAGKILLLLLAIRCIFHQSAARGESPTNNIILSPVAAETLVI
jgi:small neutral amino acid transporter SnatA (MarC family)